MKTVLHIFLSALSVVLAAKIVPGIAIDGYQTAVLAAVLLGVLSVTVRPVLLFLTFPITLVTLGLFVLVVNTFMVQLAAYLLPGFEVASFWSAFGFGIVMAIVGGFLDRLTRE